MITKQKSTKQNKKGIFFVLKLLGFYAIFELIYQYYIIDHATIDDQIIGLLISQVEGLLEWMSYPLIDRTLVEENLIGIQNTSGVIIGAPCDGISLFILFGSFLFAFKGFKAFNLIFGAIGCVLIHFLNVLRILSLTIIVKHYPESLDFHHSYTFTLFVYLFIFGLWFLRIKIYEKWKY